MKIIYFTGWTLLSISFNSDNPLQDSQLHEYLLHLQKYSRNFAST